VLVSSPPTAPTDEFPGIRFSTLVAPRWGSTDVAVCRVEIDPGTQATPRSLRWHWSEGDVAVWDEACTLHRALGDHHPSVRRMRRCTTDGERPRPARRVSDEGGGR
jgi:hypothetical protein